MIHNIIYNILYIYIHTHYLRLHPLQATNSQEYGSIYDSLDDHQILIPGPEVDLPWSPDTRDPQSEIPVVDSIIPPLSSIFPLWRTKFARAFWRNGRRWGWCSKFFWSFESSLWIVLNWVSFCYVPQPNLFCKQGQPETWRKKVANFMCKSFNPPQLLVFDLVLPCVCRFKLRGSYVGWCW